MNTSYDIQDSILGDIAIEKLQSKNCNQRIFEMNTTNDVIVYLNKQLNEGNIIIDQKDMFGLFAETFHTRDNVISFVRKEYKHYPVWYKWYELRYKTAIKKYSINDYERIIRIIAYYLGWR